MTSDMPPAEFSRVERLDTIGVDERRVSIAAAEAERAALARRFGLVGVDLLTADLVVRREGSAVLATGRVRARVTQACSVTGEPVPAQIDEPVTLRFVEPGDSFEPEEVELDPDALDTIEIAGGGVDLGEAAAETMALALDPFPRAPGAEAVLKEAGVVSEDDVGLGPFAALKAKLEGRGDS